jgi:cystathionine beta-lyase/cystathionine gamma-synthase
MSSVALAGEQHKQERERTMNFATKAIRVGQNPDSDHGAAINPIYQSATFVWKNLDDHPKFDYTRVWNPNREALEKVIAALENAEYCVCVSSGMAAVATAASLLEDGDHFLVAGDIYGGTHRIANMILTKQGIEISSFNACDPGSLEAAIRPNTKMLIFEGPTNPTLRVPDIRAIADICAKHGVISVFDNTFASPYLLNPLEYGVDIIVHSTTKYIGGHSDVVGGAVVTNNRAYYDKFFYFAKSVGLPPSPFDSWLTLRGAKTLSLRMRQHCANAIAVAEYLEKDERVSVVFFPGLASHPDHEIATSQLRGYGGMVSFELNGTVAEAKKFAEATQIILLAESLGGVESLLGYPWLMSHGAMADEEKLANGIRPTLFRLSVGIEDIEDIINDLDQALAAAFSGEFAAVMR